MAVVTEWVKLVTSASNLSAARADIERYAAALGLRIEELVEEPRRLGVGIMVAVSGETEQIESFRTELGGDGFQSSAYNPQDVPIAWLLSWLSKRLGKSRRARARPKAKS